MSVEDWKVALRNLKEFIGSYFIEFSGGEPFVKKGFLDILAFCSNNNIRFGITTNGLALSDRMVKDVVSLRPFNVNISVDAPCAEIHDYLRGVAGSFERLSTGIRLLRAEQKAQQVTFPIIVKPTVTAHNFRVLPQVVDWAEKIGATAINFQPLEQWTPETRDELWITDSQMPMLREVIEQLVEMKAQQRPIMTGTALMRLWPAHFRGEKAPKEALPCRVGLRNYFIDPKGNVKVCWMFPPIGNVKTQTARNIWHNPDGCQVRQSTIACQRLCLYTCLSHKTIRDKLRMARQLLVGSRESAR